MVRDGVVLDRAFYRDRPSHSWTTTATMSTKNRAAFHAQVEQAVINALSEVRYVDSTPCCLQEHGVDIGLARLKKRKPSCLTC